MGNMGKYGWKVSETTVRLAAGGHAVELSGPDGTWEGPEIVSESTAGSPSNAHVKVTFLQSGELEEIHVSAVPHLPQADVASQTASLYAAIVDRLDAPGSLRLVAERVFGRLAAKETFLSARAKALKKAGVPGGTPVTYVEGAPVDGQGLAGVHLTLVRQAGSVQVEPVCEGDDVHGFRVTSGDVCRVYLGGVHGDLSDPAEEQARRMFERTDALIRRAGLDYGKVVCTRIYLRRLLEWYDAFNAVRTPFYRKAGLITAEGPSRVPTSTGIQGKIADDCECFMDVTAVSVGTDETCPFVRLYNPRQNEATDYGSSFARGVTVDVPDVRYVLISGTASIDETGKSVHLDDPVKQTRRTIENFEAILKAGGCTPADLYHAVWYTKESSYGEIIRREMRRQGWPDFPYPIVQADVCRHDLLVEIDGSAVLPVE